MAITLVGSPVTGTGVTTLAMSPAAVGNAIALYIKIPDNTHAVTSITDTKNASWQRVAGPTVDTSGTAHTHEVWLGTVTATGATTITVVNSGATSMDLDGQEASSGLGTGTSWSRDGAQSGFLNNASATTITYPTLTPASAAWYIGHARTPSGSGMSGATTGFTYTTDANGNQFIANPNVTAASSPTGTSTAATTSFAIGVLVVAAASTPAPTVTAISPTSGTTSGGTSVAVTGTNLTAATAVRFGAVNAASYVVNSSTSITAVSPAGSVGTVDLTVTTAGGTSATSGADRFTYAVIAAAQFPTLILEWSPTTNPGAAPVWVDITSRLRRYSISRGRRNWLSQMSPGTATFDLDNTSMAGTAAAGAFTPSDTAAANYPNLIPGKRVRLRAVSGGVTYPRFVGFTVGYPTTWKNTDSQVTLDCVDAFGLLSLFTLAGAYTQSVLLDLPSVYWRFLETTGATVAADSSGNANNGAYDGSVTFGQPDPITDGSDHAISVPGSGATRTPVTAVTGPVLPTIGSGAFWVSAWFRVVAPTNADYAVLAGAGSVGSGGSGWALDAQYISGTSGTVRFLDYNGAAKVVNSAPLFDGAWHQVVGSRDGAGNMTLSWDGVQQATGSDLAVSIGTSPVFAGQTGSVAAAWQFAEVAVGVGAALSSGRITAHYAARTAWLGDTTNARVTHILDAIGWLGGDRNMVGVGATTLSAADDLAGKTVLQAINDAAASENGLAFVDQQGAVTLISRTALQSTAAYTTSKGTVGDSASDTIAYPMGDGRITVDEQDLWTQIAVQQKGGPLATARATTATINQFYVIRQPSTVNTQTILALEAQSLAQWLLAQSSTPQPRIDPINLKGTAGNMAFILSRELGDLITYVGRPLGVGTVSQPARILSMKETADLKERILKVSWLCFAKEPTPGLWDDPGTLWDGTLGWGI